MDTQELTVIATVQAKEERKDFVREELIKLLVPTRQEEGCITFLLHEDKQKPHFFVLYENWASHELWQKHLQSRHIEVFKTATEDALDQWNMYELTKYNA